MAIFYSIFVSVDVPHMSDAKFYASIADMIKSQGAIFTPEQTLRMGTHPYLVPLCILFFGKIIFPIMYAGLLLVFYWNLRKHISETLALFWTFILTGFPLILFHSLYAYADMPLAFFYTGGAIYACEYFHNKNPKCLMISAVFLALGINTKISGIPLSIIVCLTLFLFLIVEHRKIKEALIFLAVSATIAFPWVFIQWNTLAYNLRLLNRPRSGFIGNYGQMMDIPNFYISSLPLNIQNLTYWITRRLFTYADWHILWFVFIFVSIFYFNRIWKSTLKYLLLIDILNLTMIFYIFSRPSYYKHMVNGTIIQRIVMHIVPFTIYFIARTVGEFIKLSEVKKWRIRILESGFMRHLLRWRRFIWGLRFMQALVRRA